MSLFLTRHWKNHIIALRTIYTIALIAGRFSRGQWTRRPEPARVDGDYRRAAISTEVRRSSRLTLWIIQFLRYCNVFPFTAGRSSRGQSYFDASVMCERARYSTMARPPIIDQVGFYSFCGSLSRAGLARVYRATATRPELTLLVMDYAPFSLNFPLVFKYWRHLVDRGRFSHST